jgi:hypothetical protein
MPVIADLSRLTGFSVSAANVAERVVWRVRDKIVRVTIVGGSRLARLVARATCAVLGLPCEFRDER